MGFGACYIIGFQLRQKGSIGFLQNQKLVAMEMNRLSTIFHAANELESSGR